MGKLPRLTGKQLIKLLEKLGFKVVRQKGSHVRLKDSSGRVTTVPVHKGKTLPVGLIRKILRDIDITPEEFKQLLTDDPP